VAYHKRCYPHGKVDKGVDSKRWKCFRHDEDWKAAHSVRLAEASSESLLFWALACGREADHRRRLGPFSLSRSFVQTLLLCERAEVLLLGPLWMKAKAGIAICSVVRARL
jgi:hypothetical protein